MTPEQREDNRREFAAKNLRRRQGRANTPRRERAAARELRRSLGGSFGRLPARVFNEFASGTTGYRDPHTEEGSSKAKLSALIEGEEF